MSIRIPMPEVERRRGGGGLLDTATFGAVSKHNAFAEAFNLVIGGKLTQAAYTQLCQECSLDIAGRFATEWRALLEQMLYWFANDGRFEADEREYVRLFVTLFKIDKATFEAAYAKAARRVLQERIDVRLKDETISDEDYAALKQWAARFDVPPAELDDMITISGRRIIQSAFDRAVEDGLIADDEWDRLKGLQSSLRINVNNLAQLEEQLAPLRDRWRVLYGQLAVCESPPIALKKNETAHFVGTATWHESRKVRTGSVSFAGLSGRVRIAPGISFRAGSYRYAAPSQDMMVQVGSGTIIMTNQRIVLLSDSSTQANKMVTWREAIALQISTHFDFEIEKARGKSPFISVADASFGQHFLAAWTAQRLFTDAAR